MEETTRIIQEHLERAAHCPLCRSPYHPLEAKMIPGRDGAAEVVHIECPTCHGAVAMRLAATGSGVASIGVVSDLSAADLARFESEGPLTAETVLAIVTALRNNHGKTLFKE